MKKPAHLVFGTGLVVLFIGCGNRGDSPRTIGGEATIGMPPAATPGSLPTSDGGTTMDIVDGGMAIDGAIVTAEGGPGANDTGTPTPEGGAGALPCDPVAQTGCPTGTKCTVRGKALPPSYRVVYSIGCGPVGTTRPGDICTLGAAGDNCEVGSACITGNWYFRADACFMFCDPGNPAVCPAGTTCQEIEQLPPGTAYACQLP